MRYDDPSADDTPDDAPQVVIASVALGVGPLPFLAVYAVLFIAHGVIYPVQPPDITGSRTGEALAGAIAAVLFAAVVVSIWWFLTGRRRWPFVIGQLATFATSVDFILDSTTGSPAVPIVLVLTSGAALVLALMTPSWTHVGRTPPRRRRPGVPAAAGSPGAPAGARYVGRRRARAGTPAPKSDLPA